MTIRLLLATLAGMLLAPLACRAQLPASYAEAHDSLWQRAARIRTAAVARTQLARAGFAGLFGTRRVVKSYALLYPQKRMGTNNPYLRLRREVVKHKTHGAQVQKVSYYSPAGRLLLYEYYEGGQLVQVKLPDYLLADEPAGARTACSMYWVRGDFLTVKSRSLTLDGPVRWRTYAAPPTQP